MKINSFRLNRIKVWEPSQAGSCSTWNAFHPPRHSLKLHYFVSNAGHLPEVAHPFSALPSLQLFTFSLTLLLVVSSPPLLRPLSVSPRRPSFPALLDASLPFPPLLAWIIIFNNVSNYFCPAVKVKAEKSWREKWRRWCAKFPTDSCARELEVREVITLFI